MNPDLDEFGCAAPHPCPDCGEETENVVVCRDCDIENCMANRSCRECGSFLMREPIGGPLPMQHDPTCSLKHEADCYPAMKRTN